MNNNFNVTEFAALQSRASQIFNNTLENIKQVQSACAEISGIVASEDSGLAGSWSNMSQTLNEPINSSNTIFEAINTAMTKYAAEVIANEEKESKNLEEYNSSISALSASAMALVGAGNSINDSKHSSDKINSFLNDLPDSDNVFIQPDMNGNYTDSNGNKHYNNLDGTYTVVKPDGSSVTLTDSQHNEFRKNQLLNGASN